MSSTQKKITSIMRRRVILAERDIPIAIKERVCEFEYEEVVVMGGRDALDARVCRMMIPGHMHSEYQNSIVLDPERASCTLRETNLRILRLKCVNLALFGKTLRFFYWRRALEYLLPSMAATSMAAALAASLPAPAAAPAPVAPSYEAIPASMAKCRHRGRDSVSVRSARCHARYQASMLRSLKEVQADDSVVGFYQATTLGAFFNQTLLDTQAIHQEKLRHGGIIIVHDLSQTARGNASFRAFRLTSAFLDAYKKNNFSAEVALKVRTNPLLSSFLGVLTEPTRSEATDAPPSAAATSALPPSYGVLDLGTSGLHGIWSRSSRVSTTIVRRRAI
ncbi:translation initiation factor [Salix suchowensis]|nr:translation initiation factor [Salix suchowensis]